SIAFHNRSRSIDLGGCALEGVGHDDDLFACLRPVMLLDGFTNSRKSLRAVAGVETRSIDFMLEPRAAGKTAIADHLEFDLAERGVERLLNLARLQTCSRRCGAHRRIVVASAQLQAREGILQCGEVEEGSRHFTL